MELLASLLSSLRSVDPESLDREYNAVRSQACALKKELGLTSEVGVLKENIKKNRYKDIIPYDQSRVVLSLPIPNCDTDYINASFIRGASAGRSYIACQAPLSSTVIDFWRMIWQHDVKVIVMACREVEMGKKKCECYWSPVHQSAEFGPFTVYSQGETCDKELVVRNLTVTYQQDSHSLVQYQFLSWPDHDVPYEAASVLDLLEKARNSQGTHTSPLVIHCSAGCGRTGVICALDYIHDLLVTKQITPDLSIMKIVLELRTQRPVTVQTKDQYQFIFTAVASMFEQALQSSGSQLYSNPSEQLKRPEKKMTQASTNRLSLAVLSDTYAVVNKPRQPRPLAPDHIYPDVGMPRSNSVTRTPPPSHHYDNDPAGPPVYSTVRPRARHSAASIYTAAASHVRGEELSYDREFNSPTDDDYEDFSSSVTETTNLHSPGGIGFNCRVQKPRGPRDPPAEWSRLDR